MWQLTANDASRQQVALLLDTQKAELAQQEAAAKLRLQHDREALAMETAALQKREDAHDRAEASLRQMTDALKKREEEFKVGEQEAIDERETSRRQLQETQDRMQQELQDEKRRLQDRTKQYAAREQAMMSMLRAH